jgi:Na+(H+)/acetate symporter ActP
MTDRPYPPAPPEPPPNRKMCGFCGHTDTADKYKHFCKSGFALMIGLASLPAILIALFGVKLLQMGGLL